MDYLIAHIEWVVFGIVILALLIADLGVFHRNPHKISIKEAAGWSLFYILISLLFMGFVIWRYGQMFDEGISKIPGIDGGVLYLTAYLIEKALSVDNIFVFLVIFNYFKVNPQHQHRVLFWGIIGALLMRAVFIAVGAAMLHTFTWMIYVFGIFLLFTGVKLALTHGDPPDPGKNFILAFARKHFRWAHDVHGPEFLVRRNNLWHVTDLFVVLLIIEFTDLVFAVDSIPAVLAVTDDVFLVYTSNIFAILGLRSLYFLLSGMMAHFRFLSVGLAVVLCFIGSKMMLMEWVKIPTPISLSVVAGVLVVSVVASLLFPEKEKPSPSDSF